MTKTVEKYKQEFFLYKNNNLLDDLSYSYRFHSNRKNQILHLCSVPLVILGIFLLIRSSNRTIYESKYIWISCLYSIPHFLMSKWSALIWFIIFNIMIIISFYISNISISLKCFDENDCYDYNILSLSLIIIIISQLFGHLIFQRDFPAFRFWEFLITTPCILVMFNILFPLGWNQELKGLIIKNSQKFKKK